MSRWIVALCAILVGYSSAASQDSPARNPQQQPASAVEDFIIGSEDILSIHVWREPDLSIDRVTVRPDGKIGFPLMDDVVARGLTATELQTKIAEGLEKFVTEPQVSVVVVEIHSQWVHIMGSVGRPGVYTLLSPMSVMELLARAGGLSELAHGRNIIVIRTAGGKTRRFRFDYSSFAEGKNLQQNIRLRSGDVVIVP